MKSLPKLVGYEKFSPKGNLKETPVYQKIRDRDYEAFLSYIGKMKIIFGSDDPFMAFYRISGDEIHA